MNRTNSLLRLGLLLSCWCFLITLGQTQTTLLIKAQRGQAWQTYPETLVNGRELPIRHFGFSAELFRQINPHFAIGLAPGFMRRGTDFEIGFINGIIPGPTTFQARLQLNYVQLPFMLRFETPVWKKLGLYGQGGIGFTYLLGGYREIYVAEFIIDPPLRVDLDFDEGDSELNRFDFGWHSSFGLYYGIGNGRVVVSGDYYRGTIDVDQKNVSLNRNWAIGLGYQFRFNKKS